MGKYGKYVKTENIRSARKNKHILIADIIAKMGLTSRVSYYNIENGIVEPRISQMIILSEILEEPVHHLFNLENR